MESDELSLRAGKLQASKTRTCFACALRDAVETAGRPPTRPPTLICCREVRANRALLLELSERLAKGAVSTEGLSRVSVLLCDGSSPLYHEDAQPPLRVAVTRALAALESEHHKYG